MAEPGGMLVDWSLAQRVASAIAGAGPEWTGPGADVLRSESDRAVEMVQGYTGLDATGAIPAAELVSRDQWIAANFEAFRSISGEVEAALVGRIQGQGKKQPGALARAATGLEVGLLTGYLAQRVIGQYEVALFGPARPPRLIFVAPNLTSAQDRLGVNPELFLRWIALHEGTHAVQFAAVPWLRTYIGDLARDLLTGATVQIKPGDVLAKLKDLGPVELVRTFKSGELATVFLAPEQRQGLDRITSVMTVVEGYAEHVMDAVGLELDGRYAELRDRMDGERRNRGKLDSLVAKLLGLDMKMSQYARGKAFCDAVASRGGIGTLNRVWDAPELLPTPFELEDPVAWLARVDEPVTPEPARRRLLGIFGRS